MTARETPLSEGVSGRVRVVPNRNTTGLVALLIAMWYAGASQNNGAAYLLCFVVASVALVSLLHSHANLRGLRVSCGPIAPVLAGESHRVRIGAIAASGRRHAAIRVKARGRGESVAFSEISGPRIEHDDLAIAAPARGRFETLKLMASSLYPLGFFSARMALEIRQTRWVYPALEGSRPLPRKFTPARHHGVGVRTEGDDFAGSRAYVAGESQRHIDWKAAARDRGLTIKQWAGEADETLQLGWQDTAGLAHEARLSQLARWIVTAERGGHGYSLEVPGTVIPADRGDAHFHACLRVLALYPGESAT